eukprot:365738-Chlamydomonas_euryale.AAC.8
MCPVLQDVLSCSCHHAMLPYVAQAALSLPYRSGLRSCAWKLACKWTRFCSEDVTRARKHPGHQVMAHMLCVMLLACPVV